MRRGGRISPGRYRGALDDLDNRWNELDIHAVTDHLTARASHVATDHALRAYDSLHLATIVSFADVENVAVACWDRDLRKAAQDYGYALMPERL
jgi:predicted nucleic acid-binding protein